LKHGVSRQLLLDALAPLGLMRDEKAQLKFLNESGYSRHRSKMLNSLTLKKYLLFVEAQL
jgi:hypothetical protein